MLDQVDVDYQRAASTRFGRNHRNQYETKCGALVLNFLAPHPSIAYLSRYVTNLVIESVDYVVLDCTVNEMLFVSLYILPTCWAVLRTVPR